MKDFITGRRRILQSSLQSLVYSVQNSISIDSTSSTTSTSAAMMGVLETECMMTSIMELSAGASLAMNYESWKWAQYLAADEVTQAEWREAAAMEMMAGEAMKKELMGEMMRGDKKMDRDGKDSDDSDSSDDEMEAEMEAEMEVTEFAL